MVGNRVDKIDNTWYSRYAIAERPVDLRPTWNDRNQTVAGHEKPRLFLRESGMMMQL
jgi:hypothetical protein